MGDDEAQAAMTVLKAVRDKRILVDHDQDKLGHAIEAIDVAPVVDGDKSELNPAAAQLGKFARRSETSRKGALKNYPKSGSQRDKILRAIMENGAVGCTRQQVGAKCYLPPNVATPRCLELLEGGWIEVKTNDAGEAVTRKTVSGAEAEVLVATRKAAKYAHRHPELELPPQVEVMAMA